jgi:NAD(P)-dependent dehydrogenase (short-subunit alcohol dehydrogenase family)
MEKIFEDKVALVTGASFGIGRAAAIAFAKRGAKVVLLDWMEDYETFNAIKELGGEVVFYACDISKSSEVEATHVKAIEHFGRLDYAYNNAGIEGVTAKTQDYTEENWDKVINVNLKGVFLCMKYQIPQMLKNGKGAIVNCASIAGVVGFEGLPAYVASKHGIIGLTKTAALENARTGIRVNVVCPGVIKTPMISRSTGDNKEAIKQYEQLEPMGRLGNPEEVAEAVIWLCSDQSSFITGHSMMVDGGWTAK